MPRKIEELTAGVIYKIPKQELVGNSGCFFIAFLTGHGMSDFKKNYVLTLRYKKSKEVKEMAKNTKQTSSRVASKASKVLRDGRYSKTSKSVAGSALAQTKPSKRK